MGIPKISPLSLLSRSELEEFATVVTRALLRMVEAAPTRTWPISPSAQPVDPAQLKLWKERDG